MTRGIDFCWTAGAARRQGKRVASAFVLILSALFGLFPLSAAMVSGVELATDRITLRFDDPVEGASAFLLDGPTRIAVDVGGARAGVANASGGIVSQIRQGQYSPSTARVVFDLDRPAVVTDGEFAADGRSLTLSLQPVSTTAFSLAARKARQSFWPPFGFRSAPRPSARNNVTVPLDPPAGRDRPERPRVSGAHGSNRPLVVIDAGHGGHDAGALSADGARREKDAALAIAKAMRDELVESGRVRVALTRGDDRFLVLGDRREIARRLKADLFISVHADSAPNPNARGATVYTLSEVASDRVAAQLAAKENKADVLNGVDLGSANNDVSSILIDLAQRETMNVSSSFAALLQREMSPMVPFKSEFHRFAGLIVLKAPDVPSVLLETGYISNEDDLKLLFSEDYQHDIAVGVRRAVEAHFARRLAQR
ncbi:MAG: N-acetylmuramoyl-L-alanine amidase [Sphingomonas bacterium]|nr:N-acetylmuramoyl-L-alanine amidase [Sphingomonas bacterium]